MRLLTVKNPFSGSTVTMLTDPSDGAAKENLEKGLPRNYHETPERFELRAVVVEDLSTLHSPTSNAHYDNIKRSHIYPPIISIEPSATTTTSSSPSTTWSARRTSRSPSPTLRETSPSLSSISSTVTISPSTNLTANSSPLTWINWAGNQQSCPAAIFCPSTLTEIQSIIHQARANYQKVRCVASSYSMSSISKTDGYLVNTKYLSVINQPIFEEKHGGWTVKIQAGVSVKALEDYLRHHDPPLAMSSNVFLESVLYGGIVAIGGHGAEINGRCISDQLLEITIVDGTGTLQVFSHDKNSIEFSAACVNLGLFGVIYTMTLKVIPISGIRYHALDQNLPCSQYFDPKNPVCGDNLKNMITSNALVELIYFPFNEPGPDRSNDHFRIKTHNPTTRPCTETNLFKRLHHQAANLPIFMKGTKYLYKVLKYLPTKTRWVTLLYDRMVPFLDCVQEIPDAIHFLKNVDTFPTCLMEFSIKCDGDFGNVIKIWNQVLEFVYQDAKDRKEFPLNVALEARFNKSSRCIMSPMYDQDEEAVFFSVELVSGKGTRGFMEFANRLAIIWMKQHGALPHWGKLWEDFDGIMPHIRYQMKPRLDTFESIRCRLDPDDLFMTSVFSDLLSAASLKKKGEMKGLM